MGVSAWILVLLLAGLPLMAQRLEIHSEFVRLRPDGQIVTADRGPSTHEFISPAVPRGGRLTLRIGVEAPSTSDYHLFIGQNPDQIVICRLYQESYAKVGEEWIPNEIRPMQLPHSARLAAGQQMQSYLLDVLVPVKTRPMRFRLEVQLNVGERWVIYPLEIRIQDLIMNAEPELVANPPKPSERGDFAVLIPLMGFACGTRWSKGQSMLDTGSELISRNVLSDLLLAQEKAKQEGRETVVSSILRAGGYPSRESFCSKPKPVPAGPEWWLKVRNFLYQGVAIR